MAKKRLSANEIGFRPAHPEDARVAGNLLFETFPRKATFLIGLGCEGRARKILADIFPIPGHRLSYESTQMVMYNNKVVGAMVVFPGSQIGKLDRRLYLPIVKQYKFSEILKAIRRALPLLFINETTRNEFFISNLVVNGPYRNKGIGEKMLLHAEELAKEAGLSKISLIVDLENQNARRFYDRHGYQVKALNLIPNRQVPYLGPGSERRVKDIT
jgi:ribosomal protein S18 acetylase RimI-like enzyme